VNEFCLREEKVCCDNRLGRIKVHINDVPRGDTEDDANISVITEIFVDFSLRRFGMMAIQSCAGLFHRGESAREPRHT
jgi:hypothetical protein